jgi:serine/threonine protein kinase
MDERSTAWIRERIEELSSISPPDEISIVTDTTEFMSIDRGQVLHLDDEYFLVAGTVYESRFGLDDEPKYWVKKVIDLETGEKKIVKMVYNEEFFIKVGPLKMRCYRDPAKEGQVLRLVRGHPGFMHGYSLYDGRHNEVRIIDYIQGKSLYNWILQLNIAHEEYFFTIFPQILDKLCGCFSDIHYLHVHGLCHGDIRNDHILLEKGTQHYRWIDFDLTQDFSDYDIWSIGNILQFCVGKGMGTFQETLQSRGFSSAIKHQLASDDALAFHKNRIANLRKLFPYIPKRLNEVLLHFAINTTHFYSSVAQIVADLEEVLAEWPDISGQDPSQRTKSVTCGIRM